MLRYLLVLAVVLATSAASAAAPQSITVWRLDAGYYTVSGSQIVAFPPSGPVVPPDPGPVVPPVSEFAKTVTDAVAKIPISAKRHESALKLTATYQMLGVQVRSEKIHPTNAVAAADLICPIALGADGKVWSGVFSVVNAAVGEAASATDCAAVFDAAAAAVLSTVPTAAGEDLTTDDGMKIAAERYDFDWTTFMAFLMQLLQLLLPFIS